MSLLTRQRGTSTSCPGGIWRGELKQDHKRNADSPGVEKYLETETCSLHQERDTYAVGHCWAMAEFVVNIWTWPINYALVRRDGRKEMVMCIRYAIVKPPDGPLSFRWLPKPCK